MNILILNWRDIKHEWAGGGEVYVHELAKRWVRMGHRVTMFSGQDVINTLPSEEVIDGVTVIRRGGKYSLYLWAFWYYIKRFRQTSDVVVDVQNGVPFFTVLYCWKPKIAIVYHIHGEQFFIEVPFPYNRVGYIIEKYIFPRLYRSMPIVAISQTTRDDLCTLGLPKNNIHIVYCGINGKNALVKKKYTKFSKPTILYLGRIKKYKRVDILVKVLGDIRKSIPNVRLLIAGWGTEASYITDVSMRNSQRRRIKIIGPVSEREKRELLQKAWVFVNPSVHEGWGISVIEANLYGTPAVSFRVRGLSESIQDGKTGFLASDPNELVEKIVLLLTRQKLREKMSKNAKLWAGTFSWDKAARQSLKLIQSRLSS